jgi:hypothetical protein
MSKQKKVKKKKSSSQSKRSDWLLSVRADDPRMIGLCMSWVDHDISIPSGKVRQYQTRHRKALYNQFCPLLASECASTGSKRNPRQWAFELSITTPNVEVPTELQFTAFSTFFEAMTISTYLVEHSLVQNGLDKDTDVIVAFSCECVSLISVDNGLELSKFNIEDRDINNFAFTFNTDDDSVIVRT